MKKIFTIIVLLALSLTVATQEKKTVAVLDPICRDNSVNMFYQQMVRGSMESAVTASNEYEAYDRSAFDQIQKEQAFQRTGAVNDSQIKKMGELAGVDYVLVSEVSAYEGYLSAIVKILNVTTGKYDKSKNDYMQLNPESVNKKCNEMALSLFGIGSDNSSHPTTTTPSFSTPISPKIKESQEPTTPNVIYSDEYVDLGLPSGTLWRAKNEDCGLISNEKAMSHFSSNLPTKKQWDELVSSCIWTWTGDGYNVMGPNRQTIYFPAEGIEKSSKKKGGYWSSTPAEVNKENFPTLNDRDIVQMNQLIVSAGGLFSCLKFDSKKATVHQMVGNTCLSVRLVK